MFSIWPHKSAANETNYRWTLHCIKDMRGLGMVCTCGITSTVGTMVKSVSTSWQELATIRWRFHNKSCLFWETRLSSSWLTFVMVQCRCHTSDGEFMLFSCSQTHLLLPQRWNLKVWSSRLCTPYNCLLRTIVYSVQLCRWAIWKLRCVVTQITEIKTRYLSINLLKPTGYVMHQQFNIQLLYALPTLYLCVLYLSENNQRLVPLTS
jgi:hypothetical protein